MVGVPGFEPGSHAPKARMLPLHYTPILQKDINTKAKNRREKYLKIKIVKVI